MSLSGDPPPLQPGFAPVCSRGTKREAETQNQGWSGAEPPGLPCLGGLGGRSAPRPGPSHPPPSARVPNGRVRPRQGCFARCCARNPSSAPSQPGTGFPPEGLAGVGAAGEGRFPRTPRDPPPKNPPGWCPGFCSNPPGLARQPQHLGARPGTPFTRAGGAPSSLGARCGETPHRNGESQVPG